MADDIAAAQTATDDERRLHELGYAQELMRRMSGFSNFAVSFTIISILSGCLTLYYFGMDEGGPAIIVWGWPISGIFPLLRGRSPPASTSARRSSSTSCSACGSTSTRPRTGTRS